MKIGDRVRSKLFEHKGTGTVINISGLGENRYVEIVFSDGSIITTNEDDLIFIKNHKDLIKNNEIDRPEVFLLKNLHLKIQQNICENKIITSTNFKIKPLPHQLLAVDFVINRFKPRSLIADEVGLGKTIEAALVYEEFKLRGIVKKILIIVPSGLVLQWQEELLDKFNEHFVIYTKNYVRALKQSHGEQTNAWMHHDKIIVSIDSVKYQKTDENLPDEERRKREWHNKNMVDDLINAGFDMVIIDEAHKLTKTEDGYETARYKLAKKLSDNVPVLLLLTATPHQGKSDLFLNLLKLIDPIIFTSKKSLIPALVKEVTVRNKKRAVVDFDGKRIFKNRITSIVEIKRDKEKNSLEIELYQKITEYTVKYYNLSKQRNNQVYMFLMMLYQRIASSSSFAILESMKKRLNFLNNIESIINKNFKLEISDEYEDLLKALPSTKEELKIEIEFLKECIKIAEKITENFLDLKFKKLIEIIEETIRREQKPDLKFIIFTEFKATQNAIIKYLTKYGYNCAYINGDLSRDEKVLQVDKFKNEAQILVSTDAGGEGINLQFCYCLINFDLPWNPSRLEQRIGRVDRIGQVREVLIFNFHLKDTVEDRVREILERKLFLIKKEFGEDKFADILDLLEEEFSFEKIYFDAVAKLEKQNKEFEKIADEMYQKAKEILEKDELLLPFTNFNKDPRELLNPTLNKLIKNFIFNFLRYKNIEIQHYKENKNLFYFKNPFKNDSELPSTIRNITFDYDEALNNPKAVMINLEHPLFKKIEKEISLNDTRGKITAIRIKINKFQNIYGLWFVFKLFITNNLNKNFVFFVSVFMEDEEFYNERISRFLADNIFDNYEIIHKINYPYDIEKTFENAQKIGEEKAKEIFESIKFEWINEVNKYEEKLKDYFKFKKEAILQIHIDNIRESKLKTLEKEYSEQIKEFNRQKNIIPKLELYQVAFLEFV